MREEAGNQGSNREAGEVRGRDHERCVPSVVCLIELRHPGRPGAGGQSDREAAQDPPGEQPDGRRRREEHHGRHQRQPYGAEGDGPASDLIGGPPEEQQRGQIAHDVRRIDQGQDDA